MPKCDGLKIVKIGRSAAKLRTGERSTTRAEMLIGRSLPKWDTPKLVISMVNDMVCTSCENMRKFVLYEQNL